MLLTTDNTTLAVTNIKNNNGSEWDPMILTSYIIWTSIFKFL